MAISAGDRAAIAAWVGPIADEPDPSDIGLVTVDDVEERLGRWGAWYLVAVEVLMTQLAEVSRSANSVAAGDDRVSLDKTRDWVAGQLRGLVGYILGDPLITLSGEAERLVAQAQGEGTESTSVIDTVVRSRRRG